MKDPYSNKTFPHKIYIESLDIDKTYAGWLEGSPTRDDLYELAYRSVEKTYGLH